MKKILASLLAITMLMTTMSACVIPASAEDSAAAATGNVLFAETFEDYGSGNWLSNMVEDSNLVNSTNITGMEANAWTIYGGASSTELAASALVEAGATVEVVDNPSATGKNTSSKVLKIDASNMADGNYFRIRRNSNGADGIARADLTGKVMVIKGKFYLPTGFSATGDAGSFQYDKYDKTIKKWLTPGFGSTYTSFAFPIVAAGGGTYGSNAQFKKTVSLKAATWEEIKYVLDLSEHKTEAHPVDTYRGFYNDSVYSGNLGQYYASYYTITDERYHRTVNSLFPQAAQKNAAGDGVILGEKVIDTWGGYNENDEETTGDFGDFYGVSITIGAKETDGVASSTDYMYMDDIEVYYVDKFKQEGDVTFEYADENGSWYKGEIRIPFNNNLMETVKENGTELTYSSLFTIEDAEGTAVDGAISEVAVDGNVLVITPTAVALTAGETYNIVADALFMDENGQGLNQYSKATKLAEFTAGEDPYAHIIYDNNFDDYTTIGVNWYENVDSNGFVTTAAGVEEQEFSVHGYGDYKANQSVKVVKDPTGSSKGNVLALDIGTYVGTSTTINSSSTVYSNVRINANGKTGITRDNMGTGKKLVYEAKVYYPANYVNAEVAQFVNPATENQTGTNNVSGAGSTSTGSTGQYPITAGSYYAAMGRTRYTGLGGSWQTVRHIVDVSEAVSTTHSDTTRALWNDELQTAVLTESVATTNEKYTAHGVNATYPATAGTKLVDFYDAKLPLFENGAGESFGTFFGSHFNLRAVGGGTGGSVTASGNSTFYVDDLKAYWIDELTFNASNVENYTGGKVKLNFNQKIRETVKVYDVTVQSSSYNSKYSKTLTLKELFTVVDGDGNTVTDGITDASTENDGKTVVLELGDLESNTDYKIVINPFLIDEHGQGLNNNSTATEIDLHVGEYVPFTLESLSQSTVSGFAQGRDVKITAVFSHEIEDDAITNGIVVTDEDGEVIARNEGWTAEFGTDDEGSADYKTVIFDFSGLPTASYTITADEDFVAVNEAALSSSFEITLTAAAKPITLFEETFETGYGTENWINDTNKENAATAGLSGDSLNYRTSDGKWDIQSNLYSGTRTDNSGDSVTVVDTSSLSLGGNFSGNALKLENTGATAYNKSYMTIRRNFAEQGGSISLTEGEYAGKKLVYEADVYTAATPWETSFMIPSNQFSKIYDYDAYTWKWLYLKNSGYRAMEGTSAYNYYGPYYMWNTSATSAKTSGVAHKLKIVLDQTAEVDTMRAYVDGKLLSNTASTVLEGHARNGIEIADMGPSGHIGQAFDYADTIYGVWGLCGNNTIYVDNFKAYLVDAFNVEAVTGYGDVFNTAKATVDFTFSKAVDESTVEENVVVLNETGTEVAGAVESTELSDGGYKLTVKLSEDLPGSTKYTVKIKDGIRDTDGLALSKKYYYYNTYNIDEHYTKNTDGTYDIDVAGTTVNCTYTARTDSSYAYLSTSYTNPSNGATTTYKSPIDCYLPDYSIDGMKTEIQLTTSKATSLFAEATASLSGNDITANIKFTNPETTDMGVWAVVAAYGEYNEMLGCEIANVTTVGAGSTEDDTITVSVENGSAVKLVKIHVWNSYEDMVPYHKAETLIDSDNE